MNQIERHPRLPQPELVKYLQEKGIFLTAYSAFGNNSWGEPLLINTPEVKAIAERLSKSKGKEVTPAQVILAWSTLDNHVVIPKSVTPARIRSNFEEVELDEEAVKELSKFGEKPQRFNIPKTCKSTSTAFDATELALTTFQTSLTGISTSLMTRRRRALPTRLFSSCKKFVYDTKL